MAKRQSYETMRMGRRGTFVLPAKMRKQLGLEEGSLVIAESHDEGILIRPTVAVPVEVYSPERIAEFLLSNAVDEKDYAGAEREVRKMGLDPSSIDHIRPGAK